MMTTTTISVFLNTWANYNENGADGGFWAELPCDLDDVLERLAESTGEEVDEIEYLDNRVSLYAAQYGKCAVTGRMLWIDEIHCHHKKPTSQGGTDEYKNLVIVHKDVHALIHAVKLETIQAYLDKVKPNKSQLGKIRACVHRISCISFWQILLMTALKKFVIRRMPSLFRLFLSRIMLKNLYIFPMNTGSK